MATNLPIHLGEGGHLSIFLFGRMPTNQLIHWERLATHLFSIWQGLVIDVPVYVGRDCHLSPHLFGRRWPLIYLKGNGYLPPYLKMDGHLFIYLGGGGS